MSSLEILLVLMLGAVVLIALVVALVLALVRRGSPASLPSAAPLDVGTVEKISQLVRRDNRVEAIRVLRAATGMGLTEAHRRVVGWSDVMELRAAQESRLADSRSHNGMPAGSPPGDERLRIEASAVLAASGWHVAEDFLREHRGLTPAAAQALLESLD